MRDLVEPLERQTGGLVGMIGVDYGAAGKAVEPSDRHLSNIMIDHWNKGGLVTASWHAPNPWTGNSSRDSSRVRASDLWTPGTAANRVLTRQLDTIAASFQKMEDQGVPVLFRPWHESSGGWFWWGRKSVSDADYKRLWRYTYDYMTNRKGLDNLLWVYSPASTQSKNPLDQYPGGDVVDVVALDAYVDDIADSRVQRAYRALQTTGKPIGFAEYGPKSRGSLDWQSTLEKVKRHYPDLTYLHAWAEDWSLINNRNIDNVMRDPYTLNAGDMGGCF
jgi:mannan endo-1,4-beta-mannosidase